MKNNWLRSAKLNAAASYAYFLISALVAFFVSPYLVTYLGSNLFGILKSSQKLIGFAEVADGRPTQALKWVIANKQGSSDNIEKRQCVGSSLNVYALFFPLLLFFVVLLVYLLPSTINGLQAEQYNLVRFLGLILGANILLGPLLAIPESVLIGENQNYKSVVSKIFWLVSSNLVIVYLAYKGKSILVIATVILSAAIMNALCVYFITKKAVPWFGVKKPNRKQYKEFLRFSGWVLVWSFVSKVMLSSEILLISYLAGAELVTNYVFSSYVTQLGLSLALMTGSAFTPSMGRFFGEKNFDNLNELINGFRELLLCLSIVIGCCVLLFNASFVGLWVGHDYFFGEQVNLWIVIAFVQLTLLRGEAQIQDVTLSIKNKVLIGLFSSVSSVTLAIVCYRYFGNISSLFLGLVLGRIIMSVAFPVLVKQISSNIRYPFFRLFLGGLILIACYYIGGSLIYTTWFEFFLGVIFGSCVVLGICYLLLMTKRSKRLIYNRRVY